MPEGWRGCQGGSAPSPGVQVLQRCKQLLGLGLEMAPLGAAVGFVPQTGGILGGSTGSTCSHWVPPAWHACPCAMLKWPNFSLFGNQ